MPFNEILIGFAISYIAGNVPAIKELFDKRKPLSVRIENRYKAAVKKYFGIDDFHMDIMPFRFRSLQSFGYHLASTESYDEDTLKILALFEEELKNDHECYQFIIDLKIDSMAADIAEIKWAVKAKSKSFSEVSTALKSVNRKSGSQHIERPQTKKLFDWICSDLSQRKPSGRIAALLGDPGTGKTVIMADLVDELEMVGIPVVGLKADLLFDSNETDIDKAVNLGSNTLLGALGESASNGITVLVVDQVDALSLSLTTQRKPLAEVRKVIFEASKNRNIRVVFSCRKYDWENDLQLTEYDGAYIVRLEQLDLKDVKGVLQSEGVDINTLADKLVQIIRTPFYLSLFLRVCKDIQANDLTTIAELQKLYWDKVLLTEAHCQGYNSANLVDLLSLLTDRMINSQSLVVPVATIPTSKQNDLRFLVSNGFLVIDSSNTRIQFSHQTLFEYIFSRLFCERNSSLLDILKDKHQGLFIRNTVRRVLEYQRHAVEDEYIKNLKVILGVTNCGVTFRFHLKQLVLSLFGAQTTILPQETAILKKHVFTNAVYLRTFMRTVYAEGSVEVLLDYAKEQGGLGNCNEIVSDRIIQLLPNFIYDHNFDFAKRIVYQCSADFSSFSGHTKGILQSTIKGFAISENSINGADVAEFVFETVKMFDTAKESFPYSYVYRSLVRYYPNEVATRLREYVQATLALWDKTDSFKLAVDSDLDYLIDAFNAKQPKVFLNSGLEILNDILERSVVDTEKADIKASSLFFVYNRSNKYHNFPESFMDAILQVIERAVDEKWENVSQLLLSRSQSDFVMNHVVAITGWLKDVDTYYKTAADYLVLNVNKVFHSSSLTYYQVRLFGEVFPHCDKELQVRLVQQIMQLLPEWEKSLLGRTGVSKYPETYYGYARAQFFQQVDEDQLRSVSQEAWKALQEAKRKNWQLTNKEPNRISVMSGWRTFRKEEFEKMSTDNLVEVAKKYDQNYYDSFESPTMMGNALAMRDMVADNPDKMYQAYRQMIGQTDLAYVTMGLEALLEAQTPDNKMEELYSAIFNEIGEDVNSEKVSTTVLIDISRVLLYCAHRNKLVPQILMDFVCKIAADYHDEDNPERPNVDQNDGINQVRGCAAYALVDCLYMNNYRDVIVATLAKMADNASVATRCAALFKLGNLAYDPDALQTLFLKLTHDYNENLLKLPAHVQNPLQYLVHYRFEAVVPYFEHCVLVASSYRVNVVWLWVATVQDKDGAKELLYKMADASVEGAATLVNYISRNFHPSCFDKEEEVLRRYMDKDDETLGSTYDSLFIDMKPERARQMKPFFDDFFVSAACKYCRHFVYVFLKLYCDYDADNVLLWLTMLYESQKLGQVEYDALTDVLLLAYNRILSTDKTNKTLEDAMDLLDDIFQLSDNYMVSHLTNKLKNEYE